MMERTQISLPPELRRKAKQKAAEMGVSLAEYIRRLVDDDLGEMPKRDITAIFGLVSGPGTDIASDKQRYLDEAAWDEHLRETGRKPE